MNGAVKSVFISASLLALGLAALAQDVRVSPLPVTPNANLIQNGGMLLDQANEGTALTITTGSNLRNPDRIFTIFATSTSSAGNPTVQQQTTSAGLTGFPKSMLITASATPSTSTPAALRLASTNSIEGIDVADLAFGTAGAKTVTASHWAKTSLANYNYGVALRNSAGDRSYVHICNVPVAATWTQCVFTTVGDVTGTWLTAQGALGLRMTITLSGGSTFQGSADSWQAGTAQTTAAQTQFTDTANATFETTGWKIERGAMATPYLEDPMQVLISKLQRYYRKSFPPGTAPAQTGGVAGTVCVQNPIAVGRPSLMVPFNPPMYASPAIVTYNPSAGNANWRDVTAGSDITVSVDPSTALSVNGVEFAAGATITTLADNICIHYTAATTL